MPDRLNQVVAGEPSLGKRHPHIYQFAANIYTNTSPVGGTFYTVTVSGLPAGTKAVEITGYINNGASGSELRWRPYGSSDTSAQSTHRCIAMSSTAGVYGNFVATVTVDASGRFEVVATDSGIDIYIRGYSFYFV